MKPIIKCIVRITAIGLAVLQAYILPFDQAFRMLGEKTDELLVIPGKK